MYYFIPITLIFGSLFYMTSLCCKIRKDAVHKRFLRCYRRFSSCTKNKTHTWPGWNIRKYDQEWQIQKAVSG